MTTAYGWVLMDEAGEIVLELDGAFHFWQDETTMVWEGPHTPTPANALEALGAMCAAIRAGVKVYRGPCGMEMPLAHAAKAHALAAQEEHERRRQELLQRLRG